MTVSQNSAMYMREYMRRYRSEGRDRTRVTSKMLRAPFVGVDGEGSTDDRTGHHAYFLLRAGATRILPGVGRVRLTTRECLAFLAGLASDPVYVFYFGDYDVTKILEDLPWYKLDRLMRRESRVKSYGGGLFPVDWEDFEIDYLPRREFRVRRTSGDDRAWRVFSDVGSFFQCSFVDALNKWQIGTLSERDEVLRGKSQRASFDLKDLDEIEAYNALECRLLEALMEKFRHACQQAGYMPRKWQGPGLLAEAMFAKHGVPKSRDVSVLNDPKYEGLVTFGRNAFYGGRPEIMAVGPVTRPVYQWDINSAYPYAMLHVPCLMHGTWKHRTHTHEVKSGDEAFAICYGSYTPMPSNHGRFPMWYGLPHRDTTGTITYPGAGRGWYWTFEIQAAIHQRFVCEECWVYTKRCDCRPLGFLAGVYQERKRLGKNDAGTVLKLAMNSAYGKRVQSIGTPKYADPVTGSFVTAWCRAMIQEFIHSSKWCRDPDRWCGKDILMVATDSLCTWQERRDIAVSDELGGWSVEEHPGGMFIVQPGLYFGSNGKAAKTRGVPRSVIESMEDDFRRAFDRMCASQRLNDGDVDVPQRLFAGIRYTLHRHNMKLLGQWVEFFDPETGRSGKTIRFDWSSKRARYPVLDPGPGHAYIETFPPDGSPEVETVPYSKDIGGLMLRDELRLAFESQPDWILPLTDVA